jgi:HSP20 family protein
MNAAAQRENQSVAQAERPFIAPDVNILETNNEFVLEAEMPGVKKEGFEITLEGNVLTIVGHRSDPTPPGELVYRESRLADYRRVFELDPSVDGDKINARIEQGVLTLTLPKAERIKPRKITVTNA